MVKNKYRTILQLIIQLIHFRMCRCVYIIKTEHRENINIG